MKRVTLAIVLGLAISGPAVGLCSGYLPAAHFPSYAYGESRQDKNAHCREIPYCQYARSGNSGQEKKNPLPEMIIVKNIQFQAVNHEMEKVFIMLDKSAVPEIFSLEGDRPRVVIDIKDAYCKGKSKIPVNGKIIRQIRTYFHRDTRKLRIVLDLRQTGNYTVAPVYYKKDNIYCIEVSKAGE